MATPDTRVGSTVRAFSRRNLIAIAAGVFIAGGLLIAFDFWLGTLIDRQGQEEVETTAQRAIGLAEKRVIQVADALDRLAALGVNSCSPEHVIAMRHTAFETVPIQEVAVIAPDGQTLCTHLDLPLGERKVLASEALDGLPGYWLDIMSIEGGRPMVRLRRFAEAGANGLAALVPANLFLPQVSMQGAPFTAFAQIATRGGAVIDSSGSRHGVADTAGIFSADAKSGKFGFDVQIETPRSRIFAEHDHLRRFGLYGAGGILVVLIGFVLLMPRRVPADPISALKLALENGELVPYYQPIVDIRSGRLLGAEVLVRWRKPDGTLVFPGAFIPLAESSGLIREMTRDLMKRVCLEAGSALSHRPALKVSFNFAGKLFGDETIVKDVRGIFFDSPIKLSQVVLEVTERDRIENFAEARQIIEALQRLGVRIAIDDVGTGHSGLSYMLKLGVDIIKIDKMFVDAIGTDRNSTKIVETLVDLAHNMRMDVVAEGVENFEQVTHLRELGIRSAQGYVFAPPLPGKAFLQLVEAIDPLPVSHADEPDDRAAA
ncbi:MAG TPA: EAL domain-containing protein [Pseudolabrys sp.]|nr:EAL domain-containing protein [Pseudolabrys sp.]